mmetsp:Transcript_14282/g.19848  ORF Transcript_14282/g.19848 Transcript_14282/m.19848 type:complete len:281 (-) Transcript_14282:881-1723(-)
MPTKFEVEAIQRAPKPKYHESFIQKLEKDRELARRGLEAIANLARHINEGLRESERIRSLASVENEIIGLPSLAHNPTRKLVQKARFKVSSEILGEKTDLAIYLLSDMLIYASPMGWKLKVKEIIPLKGNCLKVEDVEDFRPGRHVFRIKTKAQILTILAASQREKKQWLESLKEFIRDPIEMSGDSGTPIWQSDSEVTRCQACDKPFQILLRRHHCRRCGRIFCAICTSARMYLPGVASLAHEPQRVCGGCAKALSQREKEYRSEILDALFTRVSICSI